MKKNIAIGILLFSMFTLSVSKQSYAEEQKVTAAVMDLDAKGIDAVSASTLSDYLRTQLVNTERFIIVTRENMEGILKEQKFQLSGCTSQECIVEMGQLLGVRKMFVGSIGKIGGTYVINIKIIDVQSGKIETAEVEECPKCEEDVLLTSVKNIARKMAGLSTIPISAPRATLPEANLIEKPQLSDNFISLSSEKLNFWTSMPEEFYEGGTLYPMGEWGKNLQERFSLVPEANEEFGKAVGLYQQSIVPVVMAFAGLVPLSIGLYSGLVRKDYSLLWVGVGLTGVGFAWGIPSQFVATDILKKAASIYNEKTVKWKVKENKEETGVEKKTEKKIEQERKK